MHRRLLTVALLLPLASAPAAADGDGYLAESGFDVRASDDAQGLAASLRWHTNPSSRSLLHFGARAGSQWIEFGDDRISAASIGLLGGWSYASGRLWPTFGVGVDGLFANGGRYDMETTVSAGARMQLQRRGSRDYALHLMAYRSELMGSGGIPDRASYGVSLGLHQGRLSPAAYRASSATPRDEEGGVGRELQLDAAGTLSDYSAGFSVDTFARTGHVDVGGGFHRLCVEDPSANLTACGFSVQARGDWHLFRRSGASGDFAARLVPVFSLGAGYLVGNVTEFYGWEGTASAGVRWHPPRYLPFDVQAGVLTKRLLGEDTFEDRTVTGVQLGLSLR